jgi:4-diphosphocytidyl-2-C-methyl-D-erythritol kinase
VTGLESVPAGPDNLAFRAAVLFLEQGEWDSGLEIELEKRIPPGTGLGGGSSDAAAVLRLLARRFQLPGGRPALLQLAYELGADVPFFAANVPLAIAAGRGERLLAYPDLEPRPLALLLPDLQIATAAAYASWDDYSAGLEGRALSRGSAVPEISNWSDLQRTANDFEPVIFANHPRLRELSAALGATRPLLAQLTGSGSALYGIYESKREREAAIAKLTGELANVRIVSAYGPV